MPKFSTSVSHDLGREEALRRLKSFTDSIRAAYAEHLSEMEENWDDNGNLQFAFSAMGLKIDGLLIIEAELAMVDGQIPFAAVPFRGRIESEIKQQLEIALQNS
jgi:hypothetical protein